MKKSLQSLVLLLMALMVPVTATAAYEQLAEGVYQDGTTLYITSGVTSLGDLQVNPSEIYCYATIPPACVSNTFTGYDATLHVPAAGMVSYFTTLYWYNFNNILSDAIEPQSVTMSESEASFEVGKQLSLSATVSPGNATPKTVHWSSTDTSITTVSSDGMLTAVAVGECDILAACVDKAAICHVTVTPERVTVTLDQHEARLLPNHTLTLNATCSPFAVDLVVTSSDPGVAIPRIVNGSIMVVGVAEGTATITVNAADGWGNPDQCVVTVYTELGDVNCDGYVNIADVTSVIDYLLGDDTAVTNADNTDVNSDGTINIADVTELIDYLLNGLWPWEEQPMTETFTVNGATFKMVAVEGGTFMMGATTEQGDEAFEDEYPAHQVTLSDFLIGQTEVTQELWFAVMGSNPSNLCDDLKGPVDHVTWNQCQLFVSRLSALTGKHFRLPTEAEWEYAARGGNKSKRFKYSGSNNVDEVAWYGLSHDENPGSVTKVVATKKPNELGLYDMSGNVMEWCLDWYGSYESEPMTNPTGPSEGTYGVFRGGCSIDGASGCRVSRRAYNGRDALGYLGLRVVLVPNDVFTVNGVSFTMVTVEGGTFTMGATAEQGSDAYSDERPAHRVTLSNYSIGETEVTQALWVAVMGNNPSEFTDDLNHPVAKVTWEECQTFLSKLNQITGKSFRFPTEAEWEFAARGGQNTMQYKYAGSDDIDEVAWYKNNSNSQTHPVATKKPNELGLYDMSGNVSEWVQDWHSDYSSSAQTNPSGPSTGTFKAIRNGGWNSDASCNRVSYRGGGSPRARYRHVGLRLAL